METTYYDTFDGKMANYHWTLRRRMENGKSVCALKTPGENGATGEWEVEESSIMRAIPKLCQLGAPWILLEFTVSGLGPICGARFTRLAGLMEGEGCTLELALDEGILTGGSRTEEFAEVEVELKEGSEESAVLFARMLAVTFSLTPEPEAKVVRARKLAFQ